MVNLFKYLRNHPEFNKNIRRTNVVATFKAQATAYDKNPQVVDVEIPVVRRDDGALVSPLFYSKQWMINVLSKDREFLATIDFEDKSRSMTNGILDSVEHQLKENKGLSFGTLLPLLPSLKSGIHCVLTVTGVDVSSELTESERDLLDSYIDDEVMFDVALMSVDTIMQPVTLMRVAGIAQKAGLGDVLSMFQSTQSSAGASPSLDAPSLNF